MGNSFANKKIGKWICLLLMVGILCVIPGNSAHATTIDDGATGETTTRTNIEEPGSAESGEDLLDMNIANSLTITQSGDNGQVMVR